MNTCDLGRHALVLKGIVVELFDINVHRISANAVCVPTLTF